MNLEVPDRVPVHSTMMNRVASEIGAKISEVVLDGKLAAKAMIHSHYKFGYDDIWPCFDFAHGVESMGGGAHIPDDAVVSATPAPQDVIDNIKDVDMPNPWKDGRMPEMLKSVFLAAMEMGKTVPVISMVVAPFTFAGNLRGVENFMMDLALNPDLAHEIIKVSTEATTIIGEAQVDVGGEFVSNGDPTASGDLISRNIYKEFAVKPTRKVTDFFKDYSGNPPLLHICGDTTDRLDLVKEAAICFSFDTKDDVAVVKREIGDKMCIMGNVNPATTLYMGKPDDVMEEAYTCIKNGAENGGYMLAAGCEMAPHTPDENIFALVRAAKTYGRYPLELD